MVSKCINIKRSKGDIGITTITDFKIPFSTMDRDIHCWIINEETVNMHYTLQQMDLMDIF